MTRSRWCALFICALCVFAGPASAADTAPGPYEPRMGQKGKDVVWIPSPSAMVEMMLDMAEVTPEDFVIDLGSGDGRNVIAAAKRGARALGVEYNPDMVQLSKQSAAAAGVQERASFVQADMFAADLSQATALVLFLIPDNLARLAPKFLALKPGTRIVSNTYEIGGGWEPDDTRRLELCASWCTAHLYVVPANVAGTWRSPDGELTLEQDFQVLTGTLDVSGIQLPVEQGRLRGNDITFVVNTTSYTAHIQENSMTGTARGRESRPWKAQRLGNP